MKHIVVKEHIHHAVKVEATKLKMSISDYIEMLINQNKKG